MKTLHRESSQDSPYMKSFQKLSSDWCILCMWPIEYSQRAVNRHSGRFGSWAEYLNCGYGSEVLEKEVAWMRHVRSKKKKILCRRVIMRVIGSRTLVQLSYWYSCNSVHYSKVPFVSFRLTICLWVMSRPWDWLPRMKIELAREGILTRF